MYHYSVNLSIAYYSRRNSIAGANVKPVFVITCARIDLFLDEIYFTLFICATSFISFALYCTSIKPYLSPLLHVNTRESLKYFTSLIHQRPYLIWIYSYHSHIAFVTSSKKYRKFSLTHFRRNANRVLPEWNTNRMLFKNVRQLIPLVLLNHYCNNKYKTALQINNYLIDYSFVDLFLSRFIYSVFVAGVAFPTRLQSPLFLRHRLEWWSFFFCEQEFFFCLIESRSTALCILERPYCLFHDW